MMDDTNEVEEATPPEIPAEEPIPSDEESEGAAEEDEVEQDEVEEAAVHRSDSGAAAAASPDTLGPDKSFGDKAKGALTSAGAATLKAGQKLGVNSLPVIVIDRLLLMPFCAWLLSTDPRLEEKWFSVVGRTRSRNNLCSDLAFAFGRYLSLSLH